MKKRIKFGIILVLVLFTVSVVIGVLFAAVPGACASGLNSVDGDEIRWGGSTKYSNQLSTAIQQWNNLGEISILPDSIWTVEDLTIEDTYEPEVAWVGLWQKRPVGADKIYLNTAKIDAKPAITTNVIMHELGHALGINDHYEYSLCYSKSNLVMWYKANQYTSLQPHDKDAYYDIWGN